MTDDEVRVVVDSLIAALQPGTATVLSYLHDDSCARPDGGVCTCDPDMVLTEVGGPSQLFKAQDP